MTTYQIALFSHGADSLVPILRSTVARRVNDLGINCSHITFLDDGTLESRDIKAPLVGAYLSLAQNPPTLKSVADLVIAGTMIVPVVPDLKSFSSYVFAEIRKINGMELRSEDPDLE